MSEYGRQHRILDEIVEERVPRHEAVNKLTEYFSSGRYTGSHFDRLEGGGDRVATRNRITADDIVAVSMLSVQIPAGAAVALLGDRAAVISALLSEIPSAALQEVSFDVLDEGSPADRLWHLLNGIDDVGWVTANKLLARKRPHLLPVYDRVVRAALHAPTNFWACLWTYFDERADRSDLWSALRGSVGGVEDISLLRCIDVALWMPGQEGAHPVH